MLEFRPVLQRDGVTVSDVRCSHPRGAATEVEVAPGHAVVFVRRGCFGRTVDGARHLLDPTFAYCMNPGDEQRFDHPHTAGDDCTAVNLSPELVAAVWGDEPELPSGPISVSPRMDLRQRLLVSRSDDGQDRHEQYECALTVVAEALESVDAPRVSAGTPARSRARRALADDVL